MWGDFSTHWLTSMGSQEIREQGCAFHGSSFLVTEQGQEEKEERRGTEDLWMRCIGTEKGVLLYDQVLGKTVPPETEAGAHGAANWIHRIPRLSEAPWEVP